MPVTGLPIAAEMALNALIQGNILSSWRITGGTKFSVVTFRFNMDNMDENRPAIQPVQYRKKPPSQVARDRKRQQISNNEQKDTSKPSVSILDRGNKIMDSELCDIESSGMSAVTENVTPEIGVSEMDKPGMSQTSGHSSPQSYQTTTDHTKSDIDRICMNIVNHLDNMAMQMQAQQEHCSDYQTQVCEICKNKLESSWKKCTDCEDFNICSLCHSKGEHSLHFDQIHHFECPNDLSCYCDSCGHDFRTRKANYYSCEICENYVLCVKCKSEQMHRKHKMLLKSRDK